MEYKILGGLLASHFVYKCRDDKGVELGWIKLSAKEVEHTHNVIDTRTRAVMGWGLSSIRHVAWCVIRTRNRGH
jgi:hypothetical protein